MNAINPEGFIICGQSSPLVEVLQTCKRLAASDSTVLLGGETGTGKEVFARYVHRHSRRDGRPFVPVNCGAIPEALLESELFGHVRGAFTGANTSRKGRVAMADDGTLFLDEVGELPLALQVKLLRLLQEKTFEPVGSAESVRANFRLVAATNRNLAEEVEAGRFRRDLYYRLMVCPVNLPPLRARRDDVRVLFNHFWKQRGERRPVHEDVMRALALHPWPGNVRELENLVERISVCVELPQITVASLPADVRALLGGQVDDDSEATFAFSAQPLELPIETTRLETVPDSALLGTEVREPAPVPMARPSPPSPPASPPSLPSPLHALASPPPLELPIDLPALLKRMEDWYIDQALQQAQGNKKSAADMLGLQRTTLVEKLRRRLRDQAPAPTVAA